MNLALRVRNFTWADLPALVELSNLPRGAQGDQPIVNLPSLREHLAQPGLSPEENCFLFERNRELLSYSVIRNEQPIGRTVMEHVIHPGQSDGEVERDVVRAALARAKELRARVLHICLPPSTVRARLLEEEGFSKVRDYRLMRWQGEEVPPRELPEGFAIASFRPGDEEKLTMVQNSSFGGSWGFCPNTLEEISYRAGMGISPPEGILFLTHGQDTAGYCWTCVLGDSQYSVGVIGMIGIDPGYRGRGLSKPILLAGMKYLQSRQVRHIQLDVDEENQPGIRLYGSVGFQNVMDLYWFEARLSGEARGSP